MQRRGEESTRATHTSSHSQRLPLCLLSSHQEASPATAAAAGNQEPRPTRHAQVHGTIPGWSVRQPQMTVLVATGKQPDCLLKQLTLPTGTAPSPSSLRGSAAPAFLDPSGEEWVSGILYRPGRKLVSSLNVWIECRRCRGSSPGSA